MIAETALLGVFAKWPEPGRAKTRMMPLLGADGAASLAKQLLMKSLRWVDACPPNISPVLWTDGGSQAQWDGVISSLENRHRWQILPQIQGHLGQRMQHAMTVQFEHAPRSMIMGTDTPTLGAAHALAILKALDAHDAAFIPAFDGGYVMVGMKRLCESAFGNLDWGSPHVAEQTRTALNQVGCSQLWLEPEPDLDEPQDYLQAVAAGWVGSE